MIIFKLFSAILFVTFSVSLFGQQRPQISFDDLMISAERDFQIVMDARNLAEINDLPHTIYLQEGIFIEAKDIENNRVVYSIINDVVHPFNNGEVAFWEEVSTRYDLTNARVHWAKRPTKNPELGFQINRQQSSVIGFVMGPESTNDAVMSFNYNDGTLINLAFIPGGNPNLSTPIEALLTPNATVLVSDQLTDNIVEFDTLGAFQRVLFGGNPAILDNCRGIELRPGTNTVLAAVAGGANQDAIAEFDLATGNHLGNFIAPNATQLNGPWDIIFRTSDCLVTGEASDNIARYDLSGNYLGNFGPTLNFPEQLTQTASGNIIVAVFSAPTGLYIFDSNGNQLNFFNAVTGLRGAFQLGNGNYMVTNASGIHVIDQNTGTLLFTPAAGVGGRSIREFDPAIIPVELTAFVASVNVNTVSLSWTTATEINNSGFSVEKSTDLNSFDQIGFVQGFGTTTEPKTYSYTDNSVTGGTYYYRLKQIDFNGSYEYSDVVEVELGIPAEYNLAQNYPNPFNPSTTIKFNLPEEGFISLKIYDVMGNEVAVILNEEKSAGLHSMEFNALMLASGTYFYKLIAGDFVSVKKMTFLK
jgi:hypothetical protein